MFKNTHNIENNSSSSLNRLQRTNPSSFLNPTGESHLGFKSGQSLSFKGLPSVSQKIVPALESVVKMFGEDFGESAGKYFKEVIEKESKLPKSGFTINTDRTLKFEDKNLGQKILEVVSYPITQMPFDLVNGVLAGLKKVPGLKDWAERAGSGVLKNKKDIAQSKSNVAAIKHYVELLKKGDAHKRFTEAHKRLAPLVPNFNAETERSLNRLVTGLIPAFFLANDAYNLSMYMKNNKTDAKQDKKRRFNQEVGRILTTTAATYGVMSIFAKQCNKSIGLTAAVTSGIVVVSEILGRKLAGNPVLPVSAKTAKDYAQRRQSTSQTEQNKVSENDKQAPVKKGGLTLNNILKTLGGLVVFGFAAEKVSNTKAIKAKLGDFTKWYTGLYTKQYTIPRKEFNELINKLESNGFSRLAHLYKQTVQKQTGEIIKLDTVKSRKKYILIHQILTFPVRFTWSVITLPYQKIVKPIINMIKPRPKVTEKQNTKKIIQESIEFLKHIKDDSPVDFQRKVNERLLSSFDDLTKSSYNNSDLNVVVKTAQSAVTTGFLIADNYNMVMIDSQGQDKDLAGQKAKERAIQRGARLTYEAFVLKLVLDMFTGVCKSSLLAALGLSGGLRVITEMVERKAVGLPLGESTQEEIKENERVHLSATGIKGSYFRAMAKLSGKKNFTEKKGNDKNS